MARPVNVMGLKLKQKKTKALARKLKALEKRVGAQDTKIQAAFAAVHELMKAPKKRIGFLEEPKAVYKTR